MMKRQLNKTLNSHLTPKSVLIDMLKVCTVIWILLSFASFAEETQTHQADTNKLDTKARKSGELYVEAEFNFQTFRHITLDISIVDKENYPIQNAMLLVSAIPEKAEGLQDKLLEQKSLLGIVRSDPSGRAYQQMEVSNSIKKMLIELDIHGANNKFIVALDGQHHIEYLFQVGQ